MCGIAAIISLTDRPVHDAKARIQRMTSALEHRGPDRQGIYLSQDRLVALGNTRLSIVDAGNDFAVPMCRENGEFALTYNGEIFDYADHRADLEARGTNFRTKSDTEVMLEGLRRNGEGFLGRLDGFWSFAFYSSATRTLLAARDLLGEKHLFYRIHNGELTLASEIPPLLQAGGDDLDFDIGAVASSFQYRAATPGATLIKGIRRLEAGLALKVTAGTDTIALKRVQRLEPSRFAPVFAGERREGEILEVFEDAIRQACRLRVPHEVDFMTTLSGGIDSSLVNVYSNSVSQEPTKSLFGISSPTPPKKDDDLDELEASRFTAEKLGNRHQVIDLVGEDCLPLYEQQAGNSFDGLWCEGLVAYQQLARHVRQQGGRVLIMSDGPDELLGGYDVDISAYRLHNSLAQRRLKSYALNQLASSAIGRRILPETSRNAIVNWSNLTEEPFKFRPAHGGTTPDVMERLFPRSVARRAVMAFGDIPDDYAAESASFDLSQRMALSYATRSLPDYYNLRSDRASMAESVELRLPFQSRRLIELMIATPARWRFKGGLWTKYILRELVKRHLGPQIAYRNKYGFAQPAWRIPALAKKLDMPSVIGGSPIFQSLPFRKGARDFLVRPDQQRHQWMAYSLALVDMKLREFRTGRAQT